MLRHQPSTLPTPTPRSPEGPLATDLGWRDFFRDPRLQTLIATAFERNRDLAQSLARIDQARAQFRIQASQRLPNVAANAGATRSQQPIAGLGFGNALPGGGGGAGAPSAINIEQYSASIGVSSFELDLWGRVKNLTEAERARYLASVEGARAFRLSLIAQVASAYFDILAGQERITVAERALAGRREGVEIARDRMEAGVTSSVDFNQAVLLLTQAEAELAELQRTTQQSRNLLDVLTGGPIDTRLSAPLGLATDVQVRPIAPGLPSALLANRPDLLQAEYNLLAANANIGAARAQLFPSISLTGSFGFLSTALGSLFEGGNRTWSVNGAVSQPIFDWGQRRGNIRLSEAQAAELVAAYQRTVQGAFQEVADGLVGRRYLRDQIDAQTRTVQAQRELAETARLRYDNGISIYLEVLDAERNRFAAEQTLIQLRALELQNAVTLYTALGGGSFASGGAGAVH
ncbi:efflux transporter outer membrane subunit [Sphingomonas faeni]|uniref:efflux transporter outer membrane subunit n=1 Tax=Sphingomonas faeni TaxID=185950 RepID=UPI0027884A97|nr:efflux transporter outer membrane subunit [Sphingomonas faeni]MDQ0839987.1 multidrug efflux system outer membrane protein [Sphingomonas faeni]